MMRITLRNYSSVLFLMAGVLLFCSSAKADTCSPSGSYADLIATGSCTIENISLSDFSFTPFAAGGAPLLTASDVTYSVIDQGYAAIGLDITFPVNVSAGETIGGDFDWTFTANPSPTIESVSVTLKSPGTLNGVFNCIGNAPAPDSLTSIGGNSTQYISATDVCENLQLMKASNMSSRYAGDFLETVDQTPEPGSLALLATGLLAMALVLRKRLVNESRLS